MRTSRGPSWLKEKPSLGLIELHRGDAEVEGHAVDGGNAFTFGDLAHLGVAAEHGTSGVREKLFERLCEFCGAGDRGSMARTLQRAVSAEPARIASGAERPIDEKCLAVAGVDASMTSESITGMWRAGPPAAVKPTPATPPSFLVLLWPCRFRGAPRRAICGDRDLLARSPVGFNRAWFPHLELPAEADKSDVRSDAGVLPRAARQNGARVHPDDGRISLRPEESGGEMIALVRIGRQILTRPLILSTSRLPPASSAGASSDGYAINAVKAVLSED